MPRLSDRQALIHELDDALRWLVMNDEEETEDFNDVIETRELVELTRFLNLRDYVQKNKTMPYMLWEYSDRDFKQAVRMKKASFVKLVELIEGDRIFSNNAFNKQAPVWIQTMVTLQVLGLYGNGGSIGRNARMAGFGWGTVCKFRDRVFAAILAKKKRVIKWPDIDERKVNF